MPATTVPPANSPSPLQQARWPGLPHCAKALVDIARKVTTVLAPSDSIRFIGANSFSALRAVGAPVLLGACVDAGVSGGDDTFFRCALRLWLRAIASAY